MLKKILLAALIVTSAAFAQVQVGGRIAFNYGGIWGDPESDEVDWGAGFIVGPEVKYSFNPMVSLISGLQLDYRRTLNQYPLCILMFLYCYALIRFRSFPLMLELILIST